MYVLFYVLFLKYTWLIDWLTLSVTGGFEAFPYNDEHSDGDEDNNDDYLWWNI